MTHRHLDDELTILLDMLIEMSNLVDEQLAGAINAVSACDPVLADKIHKRDDEVDELEIRIDQQCERILALFTPVAIDLRLIVAAVKVNTDLERIGDHAKNLAKYTKKLKNYGDLLRETRIEGMADEARMMLHQVQDAFINRDRVEARKVLSRDRHVDRLYKETNKTIGRIISENPQDAERLIHFVTMSKAVERIADHVKNIAELVVFLIEGEDIRHGSLRSTLSE